MDWIGLLQNAFASLIGGAAVYAGIKSDLADHTARIINLEKSNDKAHERINTFIDRRTK